MWIYYNLFQPVLHLTEKTYTEGKIRRKWDEATTPYERLKQTGVLTQEHRQKLDLLYTHTNPRVLRTEVYRRLSQLWHWQGQADQLMPGQLVEQLEWVAVA